MRMWKAAGAATALLFVLGALPTVGQEPPAAATPGAAIPDGQTVSDMVMKAWATGAEVDIDAIYDPHARLILDGDRLMDGRQDFIDGIGGAVDYGNTYGRVGPAAEFLATGGDLYVVALFEVAGPGHPTGDPVACFFRVHDGLVIRHVCMDAEHY